MKTTLNPNHPVALAVAPLREAAIDRARQEAAKVIARVLSDLEAASWDLNVVAPYPNSWNMGRAEYMVAKGRRSLYETITRWTTPTHRPGTPLLVRRDVETEERFIRNAMEDAAAQYDAFVAKLVRKVGDCVSANLAGSHVWGYSILSVVLPGGATQRWKTQQIVNVSKLGKLFNQWPSRIVR